MQTARPGAQDLPVGGVVPVPHSWRRFMLWVGPVMTTVALGLGASEVILYPHLTAKFGMGWLGLMVVTLFLQTVWAQELARWTVVSGEHAVQGHERILGKLGAFISITGCLFVAFALPTWAAAAASALRELLNWPVDVKAGTVFWSYVTFAFTFVVVLCSRVARKYIEQIATWTTVLAWILLIVAAVMALSSETIGQMGAALVHWEIPQDMDWWVLGSTLAWVGAGPTVIWYTYWMRDAGWGMAHNVDPIPGLFGRAKSQPITGVLPDDTPTNRERLKIWVRRSHGILWVGYFLGSLFTIFIFVGLSEQILRPSGLIPSGFDVVKHQAQFFAIPLGKIGYSLFLLLAWLLFFNTQLGVSEALVRQNTDATWRWSEGLRAFFRHDIKRVYFTWWGIYLIISFVLIGIQNFVEGANPFAFATTAAMLSLGSIVFSMAATFVGACVLYRRPGISAVKPHVLWIALLGLGLVVHCYIIGRALGFHFGWWR